MIWEEQEQWLLDDNTTHILHEKVEISILSRWMIIIYIFGKILVFKFS